MTYDGELEERMAARWAGYIYEEFVELDGDVQAEHIAAYRVANQTEAVLSHQARQEQKAVKPKNKKPRR